MPLRTQIFVFAIGEITKLLPIGNYFQNYLLQESKGTDFGLSSAATTMVVLVEVAVSLVGVTLLGLGGWTGWLRPIIIVGTLVFAGAVWAFIRLHHAGHAPAWLTRHVWWLKVAEELRRFRGGAAAILHPRIVAIAVALGVVYLTFGGAALYIAITGLGIGGVSFGEALAVYFFSLAFSLIFPLPIDLGVPRSAAPAPYCRRRGEKRRREHRHHQPHPQRRLVGADRAGRRADPAWRVPCGNAHHTASPGAVSERDGNE